VLAELRACQRIELCGIVRSSRIYDARYGLLRGSLAYLRRCGLAYSLYLLCATDVADAVCAAARIGQARSARLPVHTTRNLNDAQGLRFLEECAPDLIVSAFFDQRLREPALAIPLLGCVNIHPSLLPAFRGVDPVLQARVQGERRIGVSIHYMTPDFDAGNLLAQQSVDMPSDRSIFATTALLFSKGAQLLTGEGLARIERGDRGEPQPAGGSYESWPTRAQIRALRAGGGALLRASDFRQA
jgi:methionyl-tRNA formyltransferase